MLCRNCKHCKTARVGYVSSRSWCKLTGDGWNNKAMGVYPWLDKPHPKCPLGLVDTLPKGKRKSKKEVKKMTTKEYYLKELDRMFSNNLFDEAREFLGTGICDGICKKFTDSCPKGCALFHALEECIAHNTNDNLNELKSIVCQILNQK